MLLQFQILINFCVSMSFNYYFICIYSYYSFFLFLFFFFRFLCCVLYNLFGVLYQNSCLFYKILTLYQNLYIYFQSLIDLVLHIILNIKANQDQMQFKLNIRVGFRGRTWCNNKYLPQNKSLWQLEILQYGSYCFGFQQS